MTTNILITSLLNKIIEFWYEWIRISKYSILTKIIFPSFAEDEWSKFIYGMKSYNSEVYMNIKYKLYNFNFKAYIGRFTAFYF